MSRITINSNIAAQNAQRRLASSTRDLNQSFVRLSSGLRINRASDDAAGLSISASLNTDTRVFTQGIRNFNDGLSLLSIADGALGELSSLTIRLRELASQSANGTLSLTQRGALDEEADALVEEFNRIVESVEFNDRTLLDGSFLDTSVQGGYGTSGQIQIDLAEQLARVTGDGTFQARVSSDTGAASSPRSLLSGDFNGDGNEDIAAALFSDDAILMYYGNGDGTFQTGANYEAGNGPSSLTSADLNGDGILDLAASANTGDDISILLGNSDGSFSLRVTYQAGDSPGQIRTADVNQDGIVDILNRARNDDAFDVFLGNGDGTFKARTSFTTGDQPAGLAIGDVNGDNILDVVTGMAGVNDEVRIHLGLGDGSFQTGVSYSQGTATEDIQLGDLNLDGKLDILVSREGSGDSLGVLLGNGDGTFRVELTYGTGDNPRGTSLNDINGDGIIDAVIGIENDNTVEVFIGNGDGSFQARLSIASGADTRGPVLADFNNDGALDIAAPGSDDDTMNVFIANTQSLSTLGLINLRSREASLAAMEGIDDTLIRISSERAAIGAMQSRIGTAVSTLYQRTENTKAAESRIVDVDVATESAKLTRNQILQQAGAAVLAQANSVPQLALLLLG